MREGLFLVKFESDKIKNLAILGHGGTGKTSLTEAILYFAGITNRIGKVDEGSTISDYLPEEIKRKMSITASLAPFIFKKHKINLIDTPGYSDFLGEVKGGIRAADNALMLICGASGVEVQTEVYWNLINEKKMPRVIWVNKLDRENANFYNVLTELKENFGNGFVPLQIPIGSEEDFEGIVDIINQKAYKFENEKMQETTMSPELENKSKEYFENLVEAVAENDDNLLEKYLEGEEITLPEIAKGLKEGIKKGAIYPVLLGSVSKNIGIHNLMEFIVEYLPSPEDLEGEDISKEVSKALVWKTLADPFVGKVNFLRLYKGTLKSNTLIYNANLDKEEKLGNFLILRGKEQEILDEVVAGDIVAVNKLQNTLTGHTLCSKEDADLLDKIDFPEPTLRVAVRPSSKGDEDKVGSALIRLIEEDPTLNLTRNKETKENILSGMGKMHLEVLVERVKNKFGVDIELDSPKVPYRETIRKTVKIQGKHKKQSGGAGQYGDVWLVLEPFSEDHFVFKEEIFGGSVPKNYFPAVEKGVIEAMKEGTLAKYPVTNLSVTLVDGSYHPVDSNEMAFKIAASLALKKGMEKASPVLLEPIMDIEIIIPEQFLGEIIGDLNSKRGKILGMDAKGKKQIIMAKVPLSEMNRYTIDLKSITQGRGIFKMSFSHYEDVPEKIAQSIIEERE